MAAAVLEDEYLLLQAEEGGGGHSLEERAGRQAGAPTAQRVGETRLQDCWQGLLWRGDPFGEGTPLGRGLLWRGPGMRGPAVRALCGMSHVTCYTEELVLLSLKSVVLEDPATGPCDYWMQGQVSG